MLKNIIAPVQAWFLSQGRCVGCGTLLKLGKTEKQIKTEQKITCKKCGRIFFFDNESKRYRRAPLPDSA